MNNNDLGRRVQKALDGFLRLPSTAPAWEGRKIVIYGAGGFGRDLAKALLQRPNVTILGFLDQKGIGQPVMGELCAYPLESTTARQWVAEQPVVLIGVHNFASSLQGIKARLMQVGFSEVILPMEAYLCLSRELGWRYWMGTPQDYSDAAAPIEQTCALWADQESERLFLETLLFRLEFDLTMAVPPKGGSLQYADPTLPPWPKPLHMVDGGAYTGDTLQNLIRHGCDFAAIHAFEPDADNFQKLRNAVSAFPSNARISLWPCGLWSSTCRMIFSEGGGAGSKISEVGSSLLPVVALDDVLHGQPVNLIKLDIEGAEPDALRGAQRLIEKFRPGLAVCLYHYPHHLWSIPLWVAGLNLDYRLYYRAHEHNTFDTVLYAIPK